MTDYNWDAYQLEAESFAVFTHPDYPTVALHEELGELAGKFAKALRGDRELDKHGVCLEIGDVLWNIAVADKRDGVKMSSYMTNIKPYTRFKVDTHKLVMYAATAFNGEDDWYGLSYLAKIAEDIGSSLEECATLNLEKLRARRKAGTIQGNGDYR